MTQKIIFVARVCLDKFCLAWPHFWSTLLHNLNQCRFLPKKLSYRTFFYSTCSDLCKLNKKSPKFDFQSQFHMSKTNLPTYTYFNQFWWNVIFWMALGYLVHTYSAYYEEDLLLPNSPSAESAGLSQKVMIKDSYFCLAALPVIPS